MVQFIPNAVAKTLPTMFDLPSENPEDPGLPDEYHLRQLPVLHQTCRPPNYPWDQVFTAGDLHVYYDLEHLNWYKRPDWFVAVGIPKLYQQQYLRESYVVWDEGVSPSLVIEFLSPGTEAEDLGKTRRDPGRPPTKWQVYEQILQVPYYAVFDSETNHLRGFQLQAGAYREIPISGQGWWIEPLQLGLGVWHGRCDGVERGWLRYYDEQGRWIPTQEEMTEQAQQQAEQERQRAEQERQRAEQESQRAEQASQRADQAEQQLRQVVLRLLQGGMSVPQIAQMTGLTDAQVQQIGTLDR